MLGVASEGHLRTLDSSMFYCAASLPGNLSGVQHMPSRLNIIITLHVKCVCVCVCYAQCPMLCFMMSLSQRIGAVAEALAAAYVAVRSEVQSEALALKVRGRPWDVQLTIMMYC